jgi:hypothetical protein
VGILVADDIVNVWNYCFSSKGLIGMKRKDGKREEKKRKLREGRGCKCGATWC